MRRSPLLALLVLMPVLSLLAACGTSGGDDAVKTDDKAAATTTAAPSDDDEPVDEETTTTEASDDDPGSGVSVAALADILPTVDDIGPGYTMSDEDLGDDADDMDDGSSDDTSDDEEETDPTEQAIIEACPGAEILEELDNSSDDNTDEVSREFENEAEATIEVALDPTPDQFDEDTVDKVVEALSDCGTIKTEDEDGNAIEMDISAEKADGYGDFGVSMTMSATFSLMGTTIPIEFHGLIFDVDGTTISVVATSGLDQTTYEAVPGDYDQIPELASLMQERVESL